MTEKNDKLNSTFTVDNFSSTAELASNESKISASTDTINEKEYEPFDHRPTEYQNSSLGSLVHLVKSSLGSGILAMPNAFKNGGLVFSLVGTLVVGFICTHCVHMLVRASHEMARRAKKPFLEYSDTSAEVFKYGPKGLQKYSNAARISTDVALCFTYFMGGSVYFVFVAETLQTVISNHYPDFTDDKRVYMAMILIPVILTCQFRELKYLVPFSFVANICMFLSFGITLYYLFDNIGKKDMEYTMVGDIGTVPQFFSTVIFAMEGIGVVMPVENKMKKPQQFLGCPGVLNIAMIIVVSLYTLIGLIGYVSYGDAVAANITLSLPKEALAEVAQIAIAIAVFLTYSLQFHVCMEIVWKKLLVERVPPKSHNIAQVCTRVLLITSSCAIAVAIPELEPIISLVGAVCLSTLGILIPSIVETVLLWDGRLGKFNWRLCKNVFIGLFSLFALVSGSYFAIDDLVN